MIWGLDPCVAANGPEIVILGHANLRALVDCVQTLVDLLITSLHLLESVIGFL